MNLYIFYRKMTNKDWSWNSVSYSKVSWFSSHSDWQREANDYYATEWKAVERLLRLEIFNNKIREPACWEGHISKYLIERWYDVYSSDLIDRWYWEVRDFLDTYFNSELTPCSTLLWRDIITNPPYKIADKFIIHWLKLLEKWWKLALFLPIRYLEWKARKKIFQENPPKKIRVSSSRLKCAMNWEFEKMTGSAVCYAWFVREKWYKWETSLWRFN